MRTFLPFLALAFATAAQASLPVIDFTSQAGLASTCKPLLAASAQSLPRDDQKAAFAICRAIAIARENATWLRQGGLPAQLDQAAVQRWRAQLEWLLTDIAGLRGVLESIKSPGPWFVIEPGTWEVDFDGDGTLSFGERHFFRVPRRGLALHPMQSASSPEELEASYASPVIRVDRSDILWAIAYCDFAEAALNLVLAYDLPDDGTMNPVLKDAARVRGPAYRRLREGVRTSMRLRQSLLAEKDDDHEWIGNPRQASSSFPLVMDEQTFATWGRLLAELGLLLEGKALLGGTVDTGNLRGLTDLAFGLCPPGQGIDVRSLFLRPLQKPFDTRAISERCAAPTKAVPLSGLAALASASLKRQAESAAGTINGEWTVLRHLYWVN